MRMLCCSCEADHALRSPSPFPPPSGRENKESSHSSREPLTCDRSHGGKDALDVYLLHIDTTKSPFASFGATRRANNTLTLAAALAAATGVNYAVQQAAGDVVTDILAAAARHQCDAIILGVHGSPGWQRVLYDRTARLVTARSPLPVLLVNRLAVCVA